MWDRSWKGFGIEKLHLYLNVEEEIDLQRGIAHVDNETEETSVNILDDGADANGDRGDILGLTNPLCPNLGQKMLPQRGKTFQQRG